MLTSPSTGASLEAQIASRSATVLMAVGFVIRFLTWPADQPRYAAKVSSFESNLVHPQIVKEPYNNIIIQYISFLSTSFF